MLPIDLVFIYVFTTTVAPCCTRNLRDSITSALGGFPSPANEPEGCAATLRVLHIESEHLLVVGSSCDLRYCYFRFLCSVVTVLMVELTPVLVETWRCFIVSRIGRWLLRQYHMGFLGQILSRSIVIEVQYNQRHLNSA
jgi:hypothetical protein